MNEETTPTPTPPTKTPRAARSKPVAKPARVRKEKPQEILDIEMAAREAKERYRMAQQSAGILDRILKLVPRLVLEDVNKLGDSLRPMVTPPLFPAGPPHGNTSTGPSGD
jgi:hypothetical protein